MSEENKVYIEAYGVLWEVIDPVYEEDGSIVSSKFRRADEPDEHYYLAEGLFVAPVVYENLGALLDQVIGLPNDEPEDEPDTVAVEATPEVNAVQFSGVLGEALEVLMAIARSGSVEPSDRIDAASKVVGTHLAVFGL